MILWPFDVKTTGRPTIHKATGAYFMWAGPPYAHVPIFGTAEGEKESRVEPLVVWIRQRRLVFGAL